MDLLPTPEQEEIVSSVGSFLRSELPMSRLRELHDATAPVDEDVWRQCAALGWFGLGLPEADGGVGYGMAEEALLFREIGRHLAPGPFVATVLATRIASGTERGRLLDGSLRAALVDLRDGSIGPGGVTGTVQVYDHPGAELGLLATPSGAALVALEAIADLSPAPPFDPATAVATGRLDDARALAFAAADEDPVFARGAVLVAAMASGIAEAARDLSADYARSRVQFGRPIGVNQAIKHACSDMAVRAEAAAMQTFFAAMTLDGGRADTQFQATSAKVVATHAALANARASIQVHGGIGFTWEHDSHLFLKRAHVLEAVLGSRRQHLDALIDLPAAQSSYED